MSSFDPEAPEADVLEQALPAAPNSEPETGDIAGKTSLGKARVVLEASEADILDQAQEVPTDEDDWRG
jgi:hypothetical protein